MHLLASFLARLGNVEGMGTLNILIPHMSKLRQLHKFLHEWVVSHQNLKVKRRNIADTYGRLTCELEKETKKITTRPRT